LGGSHIDYFCGVVPLCPHVLDVDLWAPNFQLVYAKLAACLFSRCDPLIKQDKTSRQSTIFNQKSIKMAAMPEKTQAVVGIDFGTAASGYCFAFSDKPDVLLDGDLPKNPRYHKVTNPNSLVAFNFSYLIFPALLFFKAPTSLWNTPEGELRSFGLEALQGYAEDEFGDRDKRYQQESNTTH